MKLPWDRPSARTLRPVRASALLRRPPLRTAVVYAAFFAATAVGSQAPPSFEQARRDAQRLAEDHEYEPALLVLRSALVRHGDSVDLRLQIADLCAKAGKIQDAIVQHEAVLCTEPRNETSCRALIPLYIQTNQPGKAYELAFRSAGPPPPEELLSLAKALLAVPRYAQALRCLNAASALDGHTPSRLLLLAQLHLSCHDVQAAQRAYDAVQRLHPDLPNLPQALQFIATHAHAPLGTLSHSQFRSDAHRFAITVPPGWQVRATTLPPVQFACIAPDDLLYGLVCVTEPALSPRSPHFLALGRDALAPITARICSSSEVLLREHFHAGRISGAKLILSGTSHYGAPLRLIQVHLPRRGHLLSLLVVGTPAAFDRHDAAIQRLLASFRPLPRSFLFEPLVPGSLSPLALLLVTLVATVILAALGALPVRHASRLPALVLTAACVSTCAVPLVLCIHTGSFLSMPPMARVASLVAFVLSAVLTTALPRALSILTLRVVRRHAPRP